MGYVLKLLKLLQILAHQRRDRRKGENINKNL